MSQARKEDAPRASELLSHTDSEPTTTNTTPPPLRHCNTLGHIKATYEWQPKQWLAAMHKPGPGESAHEERRKERSMQLGRARLCDLPHPERVLRQVHMPATYRGSEEGSGRVNGKVVPIYTCWVRCRSC